MNPMFQRILCPIDFSRVSIPAIELATQLARETNATITLLSVVPSPDSNQSEAELERIAIDQLRAIADKWLHGNIRHEVRVTTGEPAAAIVHAEKDFSADAVIMATHGRTGSDYAALGSVTEQVVRQSDCPVITIRPK